MKRTLFLAISLAVALTLSLWPVESTFSIVANTEWVRIDVPGPRPVRWYFKNANLLKTADTKPVSFTGAIELPAGAHADVERISKGPLRIALTLPEKTTASVYDAAEQRVDALDHRAVITIDNFEERSKAGENVVLVVLGNVQFGQSGGTPISPTVPQLREGKVAIIGHALLGKALYRAGTTDLSPGDTLTFKKKNGLFFGMLTIDENPGIMAVARVVAESGYIGHPPASGYSIEPSVFDKIKGDDSLQAVWAAFVFMWGLREYFESKTKGEGKCKYVA